MREKLGRVKVNYLSLLIFNKKNMNNIPITTIQQLLENQGFDKNSKTKIVRHSDKRYPDLYNWYCSNKKKFFDYFKTQGKAIFSDCDYVIAFLGETGTLARFIGIFKVNGVNPINDELGERYIYDLQEVEGYEELKERVIIDWGKGTAKWYNWYKIEKEVVEIKLRPDLNYKHFTSFDDVILNYSELQEIFKHEYKDWKGPLSATNAIYIILDKNTGEQYIGSTYGAEGIWQRWSNYAKTGDGGNKRLIEKTKINKDYANNFQWSILTILSKTITKNEAIAIENKYKEKLGSRVFGLNEN
jgi:hypothetical protein